MQTTVILAAAGPGSRLGAAEPKAFIPLLGVPLFIHSLRTLLATSTVSRAVIVIPPGEDERTRQWLERLGPWQHPVSLVIGGAERQDSVQNGLQEVDTELVAIHDAARPFVDPQSVEVAIREAERHGACILAIPATDTLKKVDSEGSIVATIPRQDVWLAQTPQVFRTEILRQAHAEAAAARLQATDDAALVERLGHSVRVVRGNADNRKITTPEDLRWAEWLLHQRSPR